VQRLKIALCGTHCGGKTTALWKAAALLKEQGFENFTLIQEVARSCLYPINEKGSFATANWILLKQILTEYEAHRRGWQHIISDRSVYDEVVYFKTFVQSTIDENGRFDEAVLLSRQLDYIQTTAEKWACLYPYDVLFLFDPLPLIKDVDRSPSQKFQQQIADQFETYLKRIDYRQFVIPVVGRGRTTRANFVANKILELVSNETKK
jgi:hypothetical protein